MTDRTPLSNERKLFASALEVAQPDAVEGVSLRAGLTTLEFAGIIWLIMGFVTNGVFLISILLMEEREKKTLEALLLAPVSYADLVTSKSMVGVVYSVLSGLLLLLKQGSLTHDVGAILLMLVLGSLALSLIGVLLGSLANNLQTLNSYGGLLIFPLSLPTMLGLLGPNQYVQYFQFLPTYHLTYGLALALSGQSSQMGWSLAWLTIECLALFALVLLVLKRREY